MLLVDCAVISRVDMILVMFFLFFFFFCLNDVIVAQDTCSSCKSAKSPNVTTVAIS